MKNIFLRAFQRKDTDVAAFDETKKYDFTLLAFSCGALSCLLTSTGYRGNEWICGYFLLLKIQNVAEDISAIPSCGCAEAKNFRVWGEAADGIAQVNLLFRSTGRSFSFLFYLFIYFNAAGPVGVSTCKSLYSLTILEMAEEMRERFQWHFEL